MDSRTVTAIAYPNIALVKYWGKRDEDFILPITGSLSMTLDIYPTTTTVRLAPGAERDTVTVDGIPAIGEMYGRIVRFLDLIRALAGRSGRVAVETHNSVPTGAGLASSASGFAALAVAATACFGWTVAPADLSRLARRGSGSASRSIFGGFTVWHAGTGIGAAGDRSSYAEPIDAALDLALVVAVVDERHKSVSSREAMRHTVATSPLYWSWAVSSTVDLAEMRCAITRGDAAAVGEIAERNAFGMHATMLAARPSVRYLSPASLEVVDRVVLLRQNGIAAYATMDAGPNVKVLCPGAAVDDVAAALKALDCTSSVRIARPGPAARISRGEQ
ncbi:diphosphomevalonate decarboxylase [Nocardia transvalensis]|uniref:diphosphomevalonate decarboxylase n=1 Tax=Nocardia transvalensis TaxID=37333 RepID=UPI0018952A4C|nr:diphosphomevalonate decarboxylase [Nocardia transvalensis]MBF6331959.1 diphosphomevalonate decarboxylase [Nocardia transvalensis]